LPTRASRRIRNKRHTEQVADQFEHTLRFEGKKTDRQKKETHARNLGGGGVVRAHSLVVYEILT
jgi:hypothetical protein